jgi:hypothetical protein
MTRSVFLIRRRRKPLGKVIFEAVGNRIKRASGRSRITRHRAEPHHLLNGLAPDAVLELVDDLVRAGQYRRNHRLDRLGDLSMFSMLPISAITVAVAYNLTHTVFVLLLPLPIMAAMSLFSVLCWYSVSGLIDYPLRSRQVVAELGGIGRFPAQLWASDWFFSRSRFPFLDELLAEYRVDQALEPAQLEVFDQLLRERYEGSVADLVDTSRRLANV